MRAKKFLYSLINTNVKSNFVEKINLNHVSINIIHPTQENQLFLNKIFSKLKNKEKVKFDLNIPFKIYLLLTLYKINSNINYIRSTGGNMNKDIYIYSKNLIIHFYRQVLLII